MRSHVCTFVEMLYLNRFVGKYTHTHTHSRKTQELFTKHRACVVVIVVVAVVIIIMIDDVGFSFYYHEMQRK